MDVLQRSQNLQTMVTVPTDKLRQRLNRIYDAVRCNPKSSPHWGRFDYLWDLKELALLEGRRSVQIPDTWLEELEQIFVEAGIAEGRGH